MDKTLSTAISVANHLNHFATSTDSGQYFKNPMFNILAPSGNSKSLRFSYYFGTPGIAVFLAQLAISTGDPEYLDQAIASGQYISDAIESSDDVLSVVGKPYSPNDDPAAGPSAWIAADLYRLGELTSQPGFKQAAFKVFDTIARSAQTLATGAGWTGKAEMDQDVGAALVLLQAAKWFDRSDWQDLAIKVADAIIATEVEMGPDQARYPFLVLNPYDGPWKGLWFPGFVHGVSGVGYFFATLAEVTGESRFLTAAKKAANYLMAIADPFGKGKLIPYLAPTNPDGVYYLGYCHGPEGTGRLFYRLAKLTHEQKYQDFYEALIEGAIASGAPEQRTPGYWNNESLCCGTAGMLHMFNSAWLTTGKDKYRQLANRAVSVLLDTATTTENGTWWQQAWDRQAPDQVGDDLSVRAGDAGIAQILLENYQLQATHGKLIGGRDLDDPFPTQW